MADSGGKGDAALSALLESAVVYSLPLRQRFRGIVEREGVLLQGPSGWGEFAPFDDYSDLAASRWLDCAIEAAYGTWPVAHRSRIDVNAIVPEVSSDVAAELVRDAVLQTGTRTVKIKVGGGSLADDEARVASVRHALNAAAGNADGAIRLDVNGQWSVTAARIALRRLSQYGVEYVEQPCATRDELLELRRVTDVPIAVDESVRQADDPATVRVREFADIAVLKAPPLGGVRAALRIAESLGVPVVVSGALDTAVGLDTGVALAAALPDLPYASGLGTGMLFVSDVVDIPRVPEAGALAVVRTKPDLSALLAARVRVSEDRDAWWRERVRAAWRAGSGERMRSLVA